VGPWQKNIQPDIYADDNPIDYNWLVQQAYFQMESSKISYHLVNIQKAIEDDPVEIVD